MQPRVEIIHDVRGVQVALVVAADELAILGEGGRAITPAPMRRGFIARLVCSGNCSARGAKGKLQKRPVLTAERPRQAAQVGSDRRGGVRG